LLFEGEGEGEGCLGTIVDSGGGAERGGASEQGSHEASHVAVPFSIEVPEGARAKFISNKNYAKIKSPIGRPDWDARDEDEKLWLLKSGQALASLGGVI
jgi:hypothetical protein